MTEADYANLIEAIRQLSEKSILDYVIAIAPVVLSVVAVIISLCIASRQNRIDLFENDLRYTQKYNDALLFSGCSKMPIVPDKRTMHSVRHMVAMNQLTY